MKLRWDISGSESSIVPSTIVHELDWLGTLGTRGVECVPSLCDGDDAALERRGVGDSDSRLARLGVA